jgi:flagellar biogenesis protein FliO
VSHASEIRDGWDVLALVFLILIVLALVWAVLR